ncbi:hypothetical protein [Dictyobacter aurantiacus]|uniref:Uncharacterized protein n=1 Tax=Dictyobacter aurantiacus TaxID=1936993 RepID=A0A401ZCT6_9CHLR|nr:hypothetical protein [Dictyobacter aurantiacus]GCE04652.1 hypothetical protein KDAU_19810 [Dictyobacter aurantiacus]
MRNIALQTYVLLAGAVLILAAIVIALTGGSTSSYMTVGGIGAGVVLAYFMTRPRKQE